jgi:2-polyprenyl-3-methyl-5-hydroxy-6-metoxy-1,4-benzoquinol methylase
MAVKSQVDERVALFDDVAEPFDRFARRMDDTQAPIRFWITNQFPGGARALDAGCGAGRHIHLLAESYREVLGVDISGEQLKIARTTRAIPNVSYEQRSIFDVVPEEDGLFDAVMSVNAVFHMGSSDAVIAHLKTLVAPGGRLVVVDVRKPDQYGIGNWQIDYAFGTAQMSYQLTGEPEAAAEALRLMLHPRWLEMERADVPLTKEEFHEQYSAILPGVVFNDDLLGPTFCAATWQAPADT